MKEYCVDLEIAKELKENGYPQKGNLAFFDLGFKDPILNFTGSDSFVLAYAPCSDELLEELPKEIGQEDGIFHLNVETYEYRYEIQYQSYASPDRDYLFDFTEGTKLSNVLAKIWLKLKEKGYIK
jgi:hypothetical protein